MNQVEALLLDVDRAWSLDAPGKVQLKIIGAGVLLLRAGYGGGTKDSDIFETTNLTPEIQSHLLALAGRGTTLHVRHRMYVEIVPNGIPFLRQRAVWHPHAALDAKLGKLEVEVLDVVDVVVTKLKRLSPSDLEHIEAMVAKDLVPHERLVSCFTEAFEYFLMDARAEEELQGTSPTSIASNETCTE